jgi:hypothetical protein
MTYPCDLVAERLALGEPLGADGDAHVAACPACARLVRLPAMVAATAREPEPGPGFSSRMQVGARAALGARRRARVASLTLATAAAVLVGGVIVTRGRHHDEQPSTMARYTDPQPLSLPGEHHDSQNHEHARDHAPQPVTAAPLDDDELATHLVRIADVDGALQPTRAWRRAEAPLAPYHQLLVHVRQGAH